MAERSELMRLLEYHPASGLFTNKLRRGKQKAGQVTGTLHHKGYIHISINGKKYLAHRLAMLFMTGSIPALVDHKNQVKDDNRWDNLRAVNNTESEKNKPLRKDNKSGVVGVYLVDGKYKASIRLNKKLLHLGTFHTFEEACAVRKEAEASNGFHANHGKKD